MNKMSRRDWGKVKGGKGSQGCMGSRSMTLQSIGKTGGHEQVGTLGHRQRP